MAEWLILLLTLGVVVSAQGQETARVVAFDDTFEILRRLARTTVTNQQLDDIVRRPG